MDNATAQRQSNSGAARCFSCASPDHISSACPKGRLCMNCESPQHLAEACPHPNRGRDIRSCFTCGDKGHLAKHCQVGSAAAMQQQQQQEQEHLQVLAAHQELQLQQQRVAQRQQQQQQQPPPPMGGIPHQHAFSIASAWQQGAPAGVRGVPGSTKYRSASVNSNSSYDSYFSTGGGGLGSHMEAEQELPRFDSPSVAAPLGPDAGTPGQRDQQPSPFQPIYNGFHAPSFPFEEAAHAVPQHQHQHQHQLPGGPGRLSYADSVIGFDEVENKFDPSVPTARIGGADPGKSDHHKTLEPNGGPGTAAMNGKSSSSSSSSSNDLYSSGNAGLASLGQALARSPGGSGHAQPASEPQLSNETTEDKDRKKKRKKKKKKKKAAGEEEDGEGGAGDENQEAMRCFNCDGIGHLSRDCQQPRACFLCGETTHVAKQCKYSALAQEEQAQAEQPNPEADKQAGAEELLNSSVLTDADNKSVDYSTVAANGGGDSDEGDKQKKNICLNCSEPGHRLKNCPYGRKCFQCGKVGHVARECPFISEAIKLMQKRRSEENGSPESVSAELSAAPGSSLPPSRMSNSSATSASTATYSSIASSSFYSASMGPPGSQRFGGAISPFMMGPSGDSSVCSVSPAVRPDSCSPPLMFGSGAFSSFGISASTPQGGSAAQQSMRRGSDSQRDEDPAEEVDDPHLQDFVSHLLTDLEINDKA